jgi:predicted amidohydrolase
VLTAVSFSECKNFNVAHYSIILKGINMKLEILAYYDKVHLFDKGHNSESNIFGVNAPF